MTGPIRPDPFTALRAVDTDVDPASVFSRQLRARLERGVDLPRGVVMSGVTADQPAPTGIIERPGALPYLTVGDARTALNWYVDHLGARLRGDPIVMDDGRIGHSEVEIGGGVIYVADAFDENGLTAPTPGRVSVSLMLAVDDADTTLASARAGGATVERETADAYGHRAAVVIDPFGHRWMLTGPALAPTPDVERVRPGDVVYPSLCTPDVERAVRFYGAVLGWRYDAETRQVTNLGHRLGLSTLGDLRSLFLVYAVADLEGAREAIVAAGGTDLTEADGHPGSLDAADDQGARFAVYVADPDEVRGNSIRPDTVNSPT